MLVYGEEYFAQYNDEVCHLRRSYLIQIQMNNLRFKVTHFTLKKIVDILKEYHMTNFSYELCELEK